MVLCYYRELHGFGQPKFAYGGLVLGSSQITLLLQLPLKTMWHTLYGIWRWSVYFQNPLIVVKAVTVTNALVVSTIPIDNFSVASVIRDLLETDWLADKTKVTEAWLYPILTVIVDYILKKSSLILRDN